MVAKYYEDILSIFHEMLTLSYDNISVIKSKYLNNPAFPENGLVHEHIQNTLSSLQHLKRVTSIRIKRNKPNGDSEAKKVKVGVFGAQSRGKSTLINLLTGYEIMPYSLDPLTSTILELSRGNSEFWTIKYAMANGDIPPESQFKPESISAVRKHLEGISTRKGLTIASQAKKIEISSPSKGPLSTDQHSLNDGNDLLDQIVICDTPGAEPCVDDEKLKDLMQTDPDRVKDLRETKLAIEQLMETDIVIFCVSAKPGETGTDKEVNFFRKEIAKFNPIMCICKKDLYYNEKYNIEIKEITKKNIKNNTFDHYDTRIINLCVEKFGGNETNYVCCSRDLHNHKDPEIREHSGISSLIKLINNNIIQISDPCYVKNLKSDFDRIMKSLKNCLVSQSGENFVNSIKLYPPENLDYFLNKMIKVKE